MKIPELNKRILELIDIYSNGNVTNFARSLEGISRQRIDRLFKIDNRSNKYPSVHPDITQAILKSYPEISSSWLMTGEGKMLLDESNININPIYHPKYTEKKEEQVSINLYDIEAAANLSHLFNNKDQNILGQISIPNIPSCDGAVYVRGDSMYPLLKSGDIVAYKIVPNEMQYLIYGEMYLISIDMMGDEYLTVKYIQQSDKGKEWVKLVSYNTHHQPKDFPLSSVRAMALIKFSIRMNTMS